MNWLFLNINNMKNYYYVYMYRVIVDYIVVLFLIRLWFVSRLKIFLVLVEFNFVMFNIGDGLVIFVMFICF